MRINIFGGPNSGKSTIASGIFCRLKQNGYNVEAVREYAKYRVYLNCPPKSFDQVYYFAKQMNAEDLAFQAGVKHIITDAPLLQCVAYGKFYGHTGWEDLLSLALKFEAKNESVNIFLDRSNLPFDELGRFQNERESLEADTHFLKFFDEILSGDYSILPATNFDAVYNEVVIAINSQEVPAPL